MDTTQFYNQLAPVYDPYRTLVNKQIADLAPQEEAALSGLEQARLNAFRDIGVTARGRGMQFSGFSPEQEARYTGATYLPALANVKGKYAEQRTALQNALADIYRNQYTQALGLYNTAEDRRQKQEQWQKEMDFKTQQAALDRQLQYAQLSSPKRQTKNDILREAASDLPSLFKNYKTAEPGFTEKNIIPKLQSSYPELSPQDIYDLVYPYRYKEYSE